MSADMSDPIRPDRPGPGARPWLVPLLLGIAVAACFSPALAGDFVNWDDDANFLENPHYRGLGPSNLRWMFGSFFMANYQPLTWLTLGLDYAIWGMNPAGYHLTNLLLHAASAILFYVFLLQLLRRVRGPGASVWPAALAALFFAIHPLRVESVAWATGRKDVLCGLFLMLSLLAYLRMEGETREGRSGSRWLALSVAMFAASLFSKMLAIMLPVVLLALDVHPLRRGPWRKILLEKLPFAAVAAVAGLIGTFAVRSAGLGQSVRNVRIQDSGFALFFYIWKTVLPLDLSPYYPASDVSWAWLAGAVALGVAALLLRRRFPGAVAALACYAALLFPLLRLSYDAPHLVADRYSYLSCLPFAVLAAFLLARTEGRMPRAAAAAVLLALGALSFLQTRVWKDSITLWTQALKVDPGNAYAFNNRGAARAALRDREGAIADFGHALRVAPGFSDAWYNRGSLKKDAGDFDGAIADHTEAIRLTPGFARAWRGRGLAREAKGDAEGARADLAEAARLGASSAPAPAADRRLTGSAEALALTNDGIARAARGDLDGAIAQFGKAIELDPKVAAIYYNRGTARAGKGDQAGAAADYTEALKLDARFADAYADRGMARALLGDLHGAVDDYSEALKLRPRDHAVLANRGIARAKLGDRPGAAADFESSLSAAPADWPQRQTVQTLLGRVRGR